MIRLFILILLLTACTAPGPEPTPTVELLMVGTNTPEPTSTPEPTPTPAEPTETPAAISGQQVIDLFVAAGLEVSGAGPMARQPDSPLPNSYDERIGFAVAEVAPKGGQIFVCRTKTHCDALYEYFTLLIGLAGPYTYQSAGGTVVAQLNSGLTPDTAAKFQEIVESIN